MPTYHDSRGVTVQTGNRIGGGGEAEVFAIQGRSDLVAKIYHTPTVEHDRKLGVMVANPPVDPCQGMKNPPHISIAWPRERLYASGGSFAGYVMPAVKDAFLLLKAYNPTERAHHFSSFPWNYLHQTAINLAQTVNAIHERRYVIGDLNESNILVFRTALITIIDTDSFQVQQYPCPVGKPEYTPPELQGKNLRTVRRAVEHDCFGLAVLIFQLLMEGNHPFRARWVGSGPPLTEVSEKIAQGLFPHGRSPSPKVQPPPGVAFDMLHPDVANLMRRCFEEGHHNPQRRPSPAEWEQALTTANNALVRCRRDQTHYYGKHQRDCPWCAVAARRMAAAPKAVTGATVALKPQTALPPLPLVGQGTGTAGSQTLPQYVPNPQPKLPVAPPVPPSALAQFDWKLMGLWMLATVASGFLGFFAFEMLQSPLDNLLESLPRSLNTPELLAVLLGAVFGTVVGILQWLVLRRRPVIRDAGWWVLATALGCGVLGIGVTINGFVWLLAGAVIGTAQWFVLRRSVQRAGWWVTANIVASIAAMMTLGLANGGSSPVLSVVGLVLYPLLTGIALSLLLRQPITAQARSTVYRPTAPVLWVWWLLAGVVGWGVGLVSGGNVFSLFVPGFDFPMTTTFHSTNPFRFLSVLIGWGVSLPREPMSVLASWAALGGVLGLTQWVGLRRHFQPAKWWIVASAIGLAVGLFAANSAEVEWGSELQRLIRNSDLPSASYAPLFNAVRGAIIGFGLGFTQWLGLRKQSSDAGQWVFASVVGWALAWAFSDSTEGMLLAGAISSAITGFALTRLVSGLAPLGAKTRTVLKLASLSVCVVALLWAFQSCQTQSVRFPQGTAATAAAVVDEMPVQTPNGATPTDLVGVNPAIMKANTPLQSEDWIYDFNQPTYAAAIIGDLGQFSPQNGRFVVVLMFAINNTGTPQPIPGNFFVLRDAQGRFWEARPEVSTAYTVPGQNADLAHTSPLPFDGISYSVSIVFDLPPDATDLVLFARSNPAQGWLVLRSV